MSDCYVLGFAPAWRFFQSQVLWRLYDSPSGETINQGPLCVYACKTDCICTFKGFRSPCQSLVDYENTTITQCRIKSVRVFIMLKMDPIPPLPLKKGEKEEEKKWTKTCSTSNSRNHSLQTYKDVTARLLKCVRKVETQTTTTPTPTQQTTTTKG